MRAVVCKANYVANVKINMPSLFRGEEVVPAGRATIILLIYYKSKYCVKIIATIRLRELDIFVMWCIMYFTASRDVGPRGRYDKTQARRPETQGAATLWHCQPSSRKGRRRAVYGGGFFRPLRPGAGQVRDAQARQGRWTGHSRCGPGLRSISPDVLQGEGGLRAWGSGRTASSKAWATSRPQALRAGHGLRRVRDCLKRVGASPGAGTADQGAFRCGGAPSEHRSGVGKTE